nr:hypothetical protein CFP56_13352 [Quercus suber]
MARIRGPGGNWPRLEESSRVARNSRASHGAVGRQIGLAVANGAVSAFIHPQAVDQRSSAYHPVLYITISARAELHPLPGSHSFGSCIRVNRQAVMVRLPFLRLDLPPLNRSLAYRSTIRDIHLLTRLSIFTSLRLYHHIYHCVHHPSRPPRLVQAPLPRNPRPTSPMLGRQLSCSPPYAVLNICFPYSPSPPRTSDRVDGRPNSPTHPPTDPLARRSSALQPRTRTYRRLPKILLSLSPPPTP